MTPTHHLLTLWNPSYAADAMDEHLGSQAPDSSPLCSETMDEYLGVLPD